MTASRFASRFLPGFWSPPSAPPSASHPPSLHVLNIRWFMTITRADGHLHSVYRPAGLGRSIVLDSARSSKIGLWTVEQTVLRKIPVVSKKRKPQMQFEGLSSLHHAVTLLITRYRFPLLVCACERLGEIRLSAKRPVSLISIAKAERN